MQPRQVHDSQDELQVLDVRNDDEWRAGHIDGAHHLPLGELTDRQDELADDRRIVCVCRSGARSGRAASALSRAGYDAENMDGGMQAWDSAGLPFVAEDSGPARVV